MHVSNEYEFSLCRVPVCYIAFFQKANILCYAVQNRINILTNRCFVIACRRCFLCCGMSIHRSDRSGWWPLKFTFSHFAFITRILVILALLHPKEISSTTTCITAENNRSTHVPMYDRNICRFENLFERMPEYFGL